MADRLQKGHSDGSDNGGNGTLQGFELNQKIEGVEVNLGCVYYMTYIHVVYSYKFSIHV